MTVISSYFDDSRHGGIYVMAGYIGNVEMWDRVFTPAWQEVLDAAPHPLTEFKASDCRQRKGEFTNWTREECDDLTKALVAVIVEACPYEWLVGVANAIVFPRYHHVPIVGKQIHDLGVLFALRLTLADSLEIGTPLATHDNDEFQPIFDNQPKFVRRIVEHFEQAKGHLSPEAAARVSYPIFRDSKKTPPIQAADLLAYETFKEVRSRIEAPRRPVSKALEKLVEGRFHRADCVDWHLLKEYRERMKAGEPQSQFTPAPLLYYSDRPIRDVGLWAV
ncbi:MAG: DUF3800 domain-containing protein [Gemmatimonadaceae bacterium]